MSRVTFVKPASSPSASRNAVMMTFAQKALPSLRSLHPQSSKRPSAAATRSSYSGLWLAMSSAG